MAKKKRGLGLISADNSFPILAEYSILLKILVIICFSMNSKFIIS